MDSFVSIILKRDFQNKLVNLGSLSETMVLGMPCSRKTLSKKSRARLGAETLVVVGTKCAILLNRSTNTAIASCPAFVRGSWVIRSI